MPSLESPNSLKKMNYGARNRFSLDNILGDPFALSTVSISIVSRLPCAPLAPCPDADSRTQLAWIIAFVGSIIGALHGDFPNYTWWALVYYFCCIVGVVIVVGSQAEDTYHVAV